MSTRQLLTSIAVEMKKSPAEFEKYIVVLEENFLEEVESLKEVTDDQWKNDLKFPIGLINKIKKALTESQVPTQVTSAPPNQPQKPITEEVKSVQMIDTKQNLSFKEQMAQCLTRLAQGKKVDELRDPTETLHRILSNILSSPLEQKFRSLKKSSKVIQQHILNHPAAVEFLYANGFKDDGDSLILKNYETQKYEDSLEVIMNFAESLGAQVQSTFDPYKATISSTTGQQNLALQQSNQQQKSKLQLQQEEVAKIKSERLRNMEGKLEDREIEVYNNEEMIKISQRLIKEDVEMRIDTSDHHTEEDNEDKLQLQNAARLIKGNAQAAKFRDKRQLELEAMRNQASFTRSRIKIRFPDHQVLLASFGAKERVEDVLSFVQSYLITTGRGFYLFETPPKRILTDIKKRLHEVKMVPSATLYFGWSDLDSTTEKDGPFLDLEKLQQFVISGQ